MNQRHTIIATKSATYPIAISTLNLTGRCPRTGIEQSLDWG